MAVRVNGPVDPRLTVPAAIQPFAQLTMRWRGPMYAWVASCSITVPYEAETRDDHCVPGPPAKRRHATRSVKFGGHPRHCLDPHREILWRCTPAARWGLGAGSVRSPPDPPRRPKLVTFLQLTHPPDRTVPCLENPRVGGSIPPQATRSLRGAKRPALTRLVFLRLWQSRGPAGASSVRLGLGGGLVRQPANLRSGGLRLARVVSWLIHTLIMKFSNGSVMLEPFVNRFLHLQK